MADDTRKKLSEEEKVIFSKELAGKRVQNVGEVKQVFEKAVETTLEAEPQRTIGRRMADEELKKYIAGSRSRQQALTSVEAKYEALKKEYDELKANLSKDQNSLQKKVADLSTENEQLKNDLELQKARLSASFSSQELASYLNEAIADFNDKMSGRDDGVVYAITNMEVDLKAQIIKQNDKLGFITTTQSGQAALSDVKITIGSVPRG